MIPKVRKTPKMKRPRPHFANRAPVAMLSSMACGFEASLSCEPRSARVMSAAADGAVAHSFDVVELPRLVEIGLLRSVESEVREPALAGDGLDPVLRLRGLGRPEVEVHRSVG